MSQPHLRNYERLAETFSLELVFVKTTEIICWVGFYACEISALLLEPLELGLRGRIGEL